MIVRAVAWLLSALAVGVLVNMLTTEAQGWIDRLPVLLLRLALLRVPPSHREILREEWAAELHAALHGKEGRPLSRLLFGIYYAAGLIVAARRVARELGPTRHSPPEKSHDAVPEPDGSERRDPGQDAADPRARRGIPLLTPEQRAAALRKAAEARRQREELKKLIRTRSLADLLLTASSDPDGVIGRLTVRSLLESRPGVGRIRAAQIMERLGIPPGRRVRGLGANQRAALAREFDASTWPARRSPDQPSPETDAPRTS